MNETQTTGQISPLAEVLKLLQGHARQHVISLTFSTLSILILGTLTTFNRI